ncbi:MAG: hypothetical protein M0Z38_08230 [Deltaproteobacteria bacterium]|nr:hypothetical protein [Deltaproteobacteria bacterium]
MTRKGRSPLRLRTFLLLPLLAAALGCSTGNEQFLDQRGAHPAGWVSGTGSSLHYVYASIDGGAACKPCHGDDLLGGISRVSCYSASWNGFSCHSGGPVFHGPGWVQAHQVSARPDGAACKPCHGADLLGGTSGVSCYSASRNGTACHAGGPAFHPLTWLDCTVRGTNSWHATAYGNNTPPCATCHDLGTKCILCHFTIGGTKYPVGSTWSHGRSGHDDDSIADNASVTVVCVNCHDTHNRFGHPPVCHNCHAPYP